MISSCFEACNKLGRFNEACFFARMTEMNLTVTTSASSARLPSLRTRTSSRKSKKKIFLLLSRLKQECISLPFQNLPIIIFGDILVNPPTAPFYDMGFKGSCPGSTFEKCLNCQYNANTVMFFQYLKTTKGEFLKH